MVSQELLTRVQNYIRHSFIVYSSTHPAYRTNLHYEHIIERIAWCKSIIDGLNQYSGINQICRTILTMKKALEEILPCEANKSFTHSLQEYKDIVEFCEKSLG
jgi:hypothetical protein